MFFAVQARTTLSDETGTGFASVSSQTVRMLRISEGYHAAARGD